MTVIHRMAICSDVYVLDMSCRLFNVLTFIVIDADYCSNSVLKCNFYIYCKNGLGVFFFFLPNSYLECYFQPLVYDSCP